MEKSAYCYNARVRGVLASKNCKPAPVINCELLDREVENLFLSRYGSGQLMNR